MKISALAAVLFVALRAVGAAEPDIVVADFEGSDYGAWTVTGEAFGPGPARGALLGQMAVSGFAGKGLVNSFCGGDKAIGTLTSPEFPIARKFMTFLTGGGGFEGKTCMNLVVDGRRVRTAVGPNTAPGGSEELSAQGWDVSEFAGKPARLEIIDQATGGWGHINVDQIVLTDVKPALEMQRSRRFSIEKQYLHLPVKNGAKKRRLRLEIDEMTVREFEIELAEAAPDFWVFVDVSGFRGKKAAVVVDRLREDSRALSAIEQGDTIKDATNLYRETLRPQFHFSSRRGWLNDPNGLVHYAGEYHLFYQHNPYGWAWGNMHWGHAVSPDSVHWRELPIAIYPPKFGDWAFSGSAVVDKDNTAGWKTGSEEVLVAAWTSTGRGECISYSQDRGRTWKEFAGNPVVKHEGRDPRLLWHEPTKSWVMAVYTEAEGKRWIAFYTSADLKAWTWQSRIEGFFECPDFFELPVDGDAQNRKWVLSGASSEYMLGSFDGRTFQPETKMLPGHRGEAFYAAQTFSNMPDGRCVQIGWGQIATPGMPFNQMMMFPCALTLRITHEGARLCWAPVAEVEKLRIDTRRVPAQRLEPGANPLADFTGELLDIQGELAVGDATEIGFEVRGTPVAYDVKKQELACKGKRAPLRLRDGRLRLRILADRTSLEIFGDNGAVYMPIAATPKTDVRTLSVFAKGGAAEIGALEVHTLRSIWQ